MRRLLILSVQTIVLLLVCGPAASLADRSPEDPFVDLPLILEVTPQMSPSDEIPQNASRVEAILGQPARVLPMGDEARRMVYHIGSGKGLKAGCLYLLEVEYPDDVSRAFFLANRGADFVRGWATGSAVGDARRQYVEPSVESLAYPLSGRWQRRAEKLYHGIHSTGDDPRANRYTGTWFTEDHNADLTDPDTWTDFSRVLERTVILFKDQARFAGVWLRTRHTHLPISFRDATVSRFRKAFPGDSLAQTASRGALIASYEGDRTLYDRYLNWWLQQRVEFLASIQRRLAKELGGEQQVLFTPWITEQVPELVPGDSTYAGIGVVTDDPPWWDAWARAQTDGWYRWKWVPTPFSNVVSKGLVGEVMELVQRRTLGASPLSLHLEPASLCAFRAMGQP